MYQHNEWILGSCIIQAAIKICLHNHRGEYSWTHMHLNLPEESTRYTYFKPFWHSISFQNVFKIPLDENLTQNVVTIIISRDGNR